jgi:cytochrome c553
VQALKFGVDNKVIESERNLALMRKTNTTSLVAASFLALTLSGISSATLAQGNAQAAKAKVSMCIGCHEIGGYKASFPAVYSVPLIHGQSAKYLENSLQADKKGERSHPTMRAIAASMSDAEMADLAAYFAGKTVTAAKK